MMNKKVSVIIPTYKRADKIERAILSVLNQTYKNYEIIVVDDNGEQTEYSKILQKKLENYTNKNQIILLKHKVNMNGAAARNTGIAKATGDYITFLDDDDYFLPNRLESLVTALENNLDYDGAYTGCIRMYKNCIIQVLNANEKGNLKLDILAQKSFFGTGSNMFFRKQAIEKIGDFDTSFYRHQDFEYMIRFFRYFKILNVDEFTVVKKLEDRINVPNLEKTISIRNKYLSAFEKDIKEYNEMQQRYIYSSNLVDLLTAAIKNRNAKVYKKIMNEYREKYDGFVALSFKQKFKIFLYKINNIIPITKLSYYIKGFSNYFKVDSKIKKEIKKIETIK